MGSGDPTSSNTEYKVGNTIMGGIFRAVAVFDFATPKTRYGLTNLNVASVEYHIEFSGVPYPAEDGHAYLLSPPVTTAMTYNKYDGTNNWPGSAGAHTALTDYTTAGQVAFKWNEILAANNSQVIYGFKTMVTSPTVGNFGAALGIMLVTDDEVTDTHAHDIYTVGGVVASLRPFMRIFFEPSGLGLGMSEQAAGATLMQNPQMLRPPVRPPQPAFGRRGEWS